MWVDLRNLWIPLHLRTDGLRQKNLGQKDFPIQVSRYHFSAPNFSVINFSVRFFASPRLRPVRTILHFDALSSFVTDGMEWHLCAYPSSVPVRPPAFLASCPREGRASSLEAAGSLHLAWRAPFLRVGSRMQRDVS